MKKHPHRPLRIAALAGAAIAMLGPAAPAALAHHDELSLHTIRPRVGPPLQTHGPDTRAEMHSDAARARTSTGGIGFAPGSAERAPICSSGNAQLVLYARPSSSPSTYGSSVGEIRSSVRRMDAVLNADSIDSGGPTADHRVLCDGSGAIAVGQFASGGTSFSQIVSAARAAGYNSSAFDYLIFFDGTNGDTCGTASTIDDERLVATNENNAGGGYAVVYAGCWNDETPMHEVGHTMGAVQYGAPHSTGTGGHCYQENDVMCYSPDGGDLNQSGTVVNCTGRERFDCGFDDYFDAAPELGEYLYLHWNLGSPLNRFIAFAAAPDAPVTGLVDSLLDAGSSHGAAREVAGAPGEWKLFDMRLTGYSRSLTVKVSNATPGLTLYLRARKAPTTSRYACRARVRNGVASCRVDRPRGGLWVAGVLNSGGAAGAPFDIDARVRKGG